jgi:DNA-directed RNA polymerase specialized sigma24 family protein
MCPLFPNRDRKGAVTNRFFDCKKKSRVPTTSDVSAQDTQYEKAASDYGAALIRLARGYEADPEKRRDLLQEIHLALWRSFKAFQGACSLRTWVYPEFRSWKGSPS